MFKSNKPGPRKKVDKTKRYEDLSGSHVVSQDGSHVSIGAATFKRIILPSVATPKESTEKLNREIETLDDPQFGESEV